MRLIGFTTLTFDVTEGRPLSVSGQVADGQDGFRNTGAVTVRSVGVEAPS